MVWRISGWSGSVSGPSRFSWQPICSGNTAAIRSSARIRWMNGGTRLPPRCLDRTSARVMFQRQRVGNSGT